MTAQPGIATALPAEHMPISAVLDPRFTPPRLLEGAHTQSILASVYPRRYWVLRRARALLAASEPVVLDCGAGVRLSGHYAPHKGASSLVILLHGWEGGADSSYVLSAGAYLRTRGHSVFRLNLRDHGDSYDLNPGIFHSCRLAEVVGAIGAIDERYRPARLSLVGFSLGGNFALRAAAERALALQRVVAIGPVLDPARTMVALDTGVSIYQRYFIRKWRRSLQRKAALWPALYDFTGLEPQADLKQMTDYLVGAYTEFDSLQSYLAGYAITGTRLSSLAVPSSILAALDDPIIPADDLDRLARPTTLAVTVTKRGGHCGFVDSLGGPSFADRYIGELCGVP